METDSLILSVKELNMILPESLHIIEETRFKRNHYKTKSNEEIILVTSKTHNEKGKSSYWYNFNVESYLQSPAKIVIIVCGKEGFCVVPMSELNNIIEGSRWKMLKATKSYYVDLVKDSEGVYVKGNNYKLTEYFTEYSI